MMRPCAVLAKAVALFVVVNLVYGFIRPPIADISAYNTIFPGLKRMPFGVSADPYTLTVDNADAMFAAHEISAPKPADEIRIAVVGDSSVWGEGLQEDETLAGQLNAQNLHCAGNAVQFYNLGYPHPSIIKDLIFIEEARDRQPDAILWLFTLNTMMNQFRLHPFTIENRDRALHIVDAYDIPFAPRRALEAESHGFYDYTLLGQRTFLARWLKLQALGIIRAAAGGDLPTPVFEIETLPQDVRKNPNYRELTPGTDMRPSLLLEALTAGHDLAGDTPILLVNEPIFVAQGQNSEIRYNDLYPRWAFDQYRELVAAHVSTWNYRDLWNAVPTDYFSDTGLHLTAQGEALLAELLAPSVLELACK